MVSSLVKGMPFFSNLSIKSLIFSIAKSAKKPFSISVVKVSEFLSKARIEMASKTNLSTGTRGVNSFGLKSISFALRSKGSFVAA